MVTAPCGAASGPRTGNPSHTHRIMVLESERRECSAKKRPPIPKAARTDEPCFRSWGDSLPLMRVLRVVRRTAKNARINPMPLYPPFEACEVGQMGLLVCHANLTTLCMIRPTVQAVILDSSCVGWKASVNHVATQP